MPDTDSTTLISLFHSPGEAHDAIADLQQAGIPASGIQKIGEESGVTLDSLQELGLPTDDLRMLTDGVHAGGIVLIVSGSADLAEEAEAIFKKHHAHKVDEQTLDDSLGEIATGAPGADLTGETVIPVIEEELVVGKKAVRTGSIRVFSRLVETPVEEIVTLHEDHAVIERRPVDRAVTEEDFHVQTVEVLETGEEVVVSKSAKVVGEVVVRKDSETRTETVSDTVRKTEIEVEQVGSLGSKSFQGERS